MDQEGEWWVRHERTTKSFARIRLDAVKGLQWGINALFSKPVWRDSTTLHIRAGFGPAFLDVAEGYVFIEEGQVICKVRFIWPFISLVIKDKTLSDIGAMAIDVAGSPFESKEVFIVHGHSETAKTQLKKPFGSPRPRARHSGRTDPSRSHDHGGARVLFNHFFFCDRAHDPRRSGRGRRRKFASARTSERHP